MSSINSKIASQRLKIFFLLHYLSDCLLVVSVKLPVHLTLGIICIIWIDMQNLIHTMHCALYTAVTMAWDDYVWNASTHFDWKITQKNNNAVNDKWINFIGYITGVEIIANRYIEMTSFPYLSLLVKLSVLHLMFLSLIFISQYKSSPFSVYDDVVWSREQVIWQSAKTRAASDGWRKMSASRERKQPECRTVGERYNTFYAFLETNIFFIKPIKNYFCTQYLK